MFGIPISGHNICGYKRGDDSQPATRELCTRSYQLAFVTALAIYNSGDTNKGLAPYPDDA
jgi:alpha-glucosidase (family GH31 glycosyl hydrolase)